MNDDTISRAAALDALGEEPLVWHDGEDEIAERNQWRRDVAAIKALPSAQRWIKVTPKTLPKTEEKVLVTCEYLDIYGKPHRYVCKAFHVDRFTMESNENWDEGCDEYREEDDQFYVLEGWYECIHNWGDYSSVRITEDKVVAWCTLPEPYKEHADADHD